MTLRQVELLIQPLREFTAYTLQPWIDTKTDNFVTSLQMPSRYIRKLEEAKIIHQKPITPPVYSNRRDFKFYSFKEQETLFYREIDHRAMIADLALAFSYYFPGCDIGYEKDIKTSKDRDVRCDIVVDYEGYRWVVELERSLTPLQIKDKKLTRYKHLAEKAKILFVYAPRDYQFSFRPMQYKENPQVIGKSNAGVEELARYFDKPYYLAMSFHNFHKLNKGVWLNSKGNKVSLINK